MTHWQGLVSRICSLFASHFFDSMANTKGFFSFNKAKRIYYLFSVALNGVSFPPMIRQTEDREKPLLRLSRISILGGLTRNRRGRRLTYRSSAQKRKKGPLPFCILILWGNWSCASYVFFNPASSRARFQDGSLSFFKLP